MGDCGIDMSSIITRSISEYGDNLEAPKWYNGSNESWITELNIVYLPYCTIIEKIDKDKLLIIQEKCEPYYSIKN